MQVIGGVNPVREALSRGEGVKKILLAEGRDKKNITDILDMAAAKKIPLEFQNRAFLDRIYQGKHQGIVVYLDEFRYAELDRIIVDSLPNMILLILDGVTDPRNLGAIIRTAHCFGVRGIIVPKRRSADVTPVVMKASAGAAIWMPVVKEVNLVRTVAYLKEKGFWIYGAEAEGGINLGELKVTGPVALVIGGEERGIRPLMRKNCDFIISIPMIGEVSSLNVVVACGIILYDMRRKLAGEV